jgi:hypothetical protein
MCGAHSLVLAKAIEESLDILFDVEVIEVVLFIELRHLGKALFEKGQGEVKTVLGLVALPNGQDDDAVGLALLDQRRISIVALEQGAEKIINWCNLREEAAILVDKDVVKSGVASCLFLELQKGRLKELSHIILKDLV